MFAINYRIVQSEYDDFVGQHGFFQIKCNGHVYGEMYPKEIEDIMEKVPLYDWFERLAKVIQNLMTKDYVALSDIESYNTWIVFQKRNEEVTISIVKAKKESGSHDIEFALSEPEVGEWTNQTINLEQLKQEVIEKGREYIRKILAANKEKAIVEQIEQRFNEILQYLS